MAAKNISFKEFKTAVKALNKVLTESGSKAIKVVGVKKEVVIEKFTNVVLEFIDENKTEDLPNTVIDFYNNSIVGAEDETEDNKPSPKKKEKKEKKPKRDFFVPNKSGRPKFIVESLKKGGKQADIVQRADDAYVKDGGASNIKQSNRLFENAVRYLYYAGLVDISEKGEYTVK